MIRFFKRLWNLIFVKANKELDKHENSKDNADEQIRLLNIELQSALASEVDVKAKSIEFRKKASVKTEEANSLRKKAVIVDDNIKDITDAEEIKTKEALIIDALDKADSCDNEAKSYITIADENDRQVKIINDKIIGLRKTIDIAKNRIDIADAKIKTGEALDNVNKQVNSLETGNIDNIIKGMEAKGDALLNKAEATDSIAYDNRSLDQRLDEELKSSSQKSNADKLAAFRSSRQK